jgi:hypothetical protein
VDELGSDPYLTISGMALMYSQNCLDSGKDSDALNAVSDAFVLMMQQKDRLLSDLEKVRAIGLLFRAGELSERMGNDNDAQSFYEDSVDLGFKWFKITRDNSLVTIEFPRILPSLTSWMFDTGKKEYLTPDPSEPVVRLARLHSRKGRFQLSGLLVGLGSRAHSRAESLLIFLPKPSL